MRVAVLIPAYQAEGSIGEVVADVSAQRIPVYVVDDGSTDRTSERARAAGADVVRHDSNRGKGAALVSGMRHLDTRGFSHALTMDADGQHLAREVPKLLAAASAEPGAIIVGARSIGGQSVASVNLLGNAVANLAVRFAAGAPLGDTQSGFRVYPLAPVLSLPVLGDRFEYETTVLILAVRAGIAVRSVSVDVYYPPIAERRTHYRKVLDTLRIMRAVVPLLARH